MQHSALIKLTFLGILLTITAQTAAIADEPKDHIPVSLATSLKNGTSHNIRFSLWDSETEGAMLWSEETKVKITKGAITHFLGSVSPLGADYFSLQTWLQIERKVSGNKVKQVGKRILLGSTAYSLHAKSVARGAVGTAALEDGAVTDTKISGPISASKIAGNIALTSDLEQSVKAHTDRTDNPHATTYTQLGAAAAAHSHSDLSGTVSTHTADTSNPHATTYSQVGAAAADHNHNSSYLGINAAAGGDLSGSFPSPSVSKLQGRAVSALAPSSSDVLSWNGAQWAPSGRITGITAGAGLSGGGSSGEVTLAASYVLPRTVTVPSNGSNAENGIALVDALAAITDATAGKRYLLKLDAGIYDLGSTTVMMKPYVDIEGSGDRATVITRGGFALTTSGTVIGANNAELRNLQVENTGGATAAIAFYSSSASPTLKDVYLRVVGGSGSSYGAYITGISTAVKLDDVKIMAGSTPASYGVYVDNATNLWLHDVDIDADATGSAYGVQCLSGSANLTIDHSTIDAITSGSQAAAFANYSCTSDVRFSHLRSQGGTSFTHGLYILVGTVNVLAANTAAVGASGTTYGIYAQNSTLKADSVVVQASGATAENIALYSFQNMGGTQNTYVRNSRFNAGGATSSAGLKSNSITTLDVQNTLAEASGSSSAMAFWPVNHNFTAANSKFACTGGTFCYGAYLALTSAGPFTGTFQNTTITASGGGSNTGIVGVGGAGSHSVYVNNSGVYGATNTINSPATIATKVGGSLLSGGATAGGGVTCAGVYDENYSFSAGACL